MTSSVLETRLPRRSESCTYRWRSQEKDLRGKVYVVADNGSMATFLQESFKDFSDDSTIDDALVTLGMANKEAKFADMTVQLMPHQILGVAFMLEKEKDRFKRGGLLCDAMGLGKVSSPPYHFETSWARADQCRQSRLSLR